AARIHSQQPADHRQQGGLAGAIGADDRGHAPRLQGQRYVVDDDALAVGLFYRSGDDHRAAPLRIRKMKTSPPRNSMMIDNAVPKANTRSMSVCPPTRQMMATRIEVGRV